MNAADVLEHLRQEGVLVIMQGKTVRVLSPPDKQDTVESLIRQYTPDATAPLAINFTVVDLEYLPALIMESHNVQAELTGNGKVELNLTETQVTLYGNPQSITLKRLQNSLGPLTIIKKKPFIPFPGGGRQGVAMLTTAARTQLMNAALGATAALVEASSKETVEQILKNTLQPEFQQEVHVTLRPPKVSGQVTRPSPRDSRPEADAKGNAPRRPTDGKES